jgi:hypothetical protein
MIIEIYLVLFEFHHGGERAHMHDMSSRTLFELEHDGGKTSRAGCTELLEALARSCAVVLVVHAKSHDK